MFCLAAAWAVPKGGQRYPTHNANADRQFEKQSLEIVLLSTSRELIIIPTNVTWWRVARRYCDFGELIRTDCPYGDSVLGRIPQRPSVLSRDRPDDGLNCFVLIQAPDSAPVPFVHQDRRRAHDEAAGAILQAVVRHYRPVCSFTFASAGPITFSLSAASSRS